MGTQNSFNLAALVKESLSVDALTPKDVMQGVLDASRQVLNAASEGHPEHGMIQSLVALRNAAGHDVAVYLGENSENSARFGNGVLLKDAIPRMCDQFLLRCYRLAQMNSARFNFLNFMYEGETARLRKSMELVAKGYYPHQAAHIVFGREFLEKGYGISPVRLLHP